MKYWVLCICICILISCKENVKESEPTASIDSIGLDHLEIANEKDPICDMNVKEHLSDTAMINGQIWGFCSIVCKEKYIQAQKAK